MRRARVEAEAARDRARAAQRQAQDEVEALSERVAQLERAVEAQPDDARALNNLGVVKWAQGETDAAKRHFDDALKANHPTK